MSFTAIILAAGKGSRMKSSLAKPLHKIAGQEMIAWVIDAANAAGATSIIPVISRDTADLEQYLENNLAGSAIAIQEQANGTAGALMAALPLIQNTTQPIIVLYADTPFIDSTIISNLTTNIQSGTDICVLGSTIDNPTGYGRLLVSSAGILQAIIEESEASEAHKSITNVNAGIMAFNGNILAQMLQQIEPANSKNEYFLTDIVSIGARNNLKIDYFLAEQDSVIGINTLEQLAEAEAMAQKRLRSAAMLSGVTMMAPETVFLRKDTCFGNDVIIEPNVTIAAKVKIGDGCHIRSFCYLEECEIGNYNVLGPYARIRPGTVTSQDVKIGNFVEIKKATLGKGAKVNHLSYIGDSLIGDKVNIGAGTITCNYDGYNKFVTEIGHGAFIGSNTALVAPVKIGEQSIIGAGSTITQDVPENALSVSRSDQRTIKQGATKFRSKKKANR